MSRFFFSPVQFFFWCGSIRFDSVRSVCLSIKRFSSLKLESIKHKINERTHHIIWLTSFIRIWITFLRYTWERFTGYCIIVWARCIHFNCGRFAVLIRSFCIFSDTENEEWEEKKWFKYGKHRANMFKWQKNSLHPNTLIHHTVSHVNKIEKWHCF